MSRTALDLWVGVFVAIGFGALVFLAMQVGNFSLFGDSRHYRVEAAFDNIGGLKARAPVKSAGVLVGRVHAIRFDPHSFRAVVTLDLDASYEFPADTTASILTSGLLGEQYIGLEAGADIEPLVEGDQIILTQSAVVLEKLIGQFLFDKAAEPAAP